ncbi:MAG: EamA family transporter [Candidatus Euphemobacter frigidus]|nr:EamA family transporter [Candidatus Euphemobacter frigidus]MDP8276030.1 EamA family transporter [Candidatus Euphemobacter frigidus]
MIYLIVVSLIWAFSFGLIKTYLIGSLAGVDPTFIAWARMAIALPVFLPFLRLKRVPRPVAGRLFIIGIVQYGLMYITYLQAFRYLEAYQVALFTIFTPLYVTLFHDLRTRRFRSRSLLAAALAVLGAAVITYQRIGRDGILTGFLFMQISNLCFAYGQIEYKRLRPAFAHLKDHQVYALLYLGAAAVTALATTLTGGWGSLAGLDLQQAGTLLYLGVLASGLCFFWWNKGAVLTDAGTLAVFNNLKIPLAVTVSLLVFGESTDLPRLMLGGGLMIFAIWISRRR